MLDQVERLADILSLTLQPQTTASVFLQVFKFKQIVVLTGLDKKSSKSETKTRPSKNVVESMTRPRPVFAIRFVTLLDTSTALAFSLIPKHVSITFLRLTYL